jgi:F0F1-type ATP synthase delta subunit
MIHVTSSSELNYDLKSLLEQKLKNKFGDLEIQYAVDPKLILGLTIKVDDEEYYSNLNYEINYILSQLLK